MTTTETEPTFTPIRPNPYIIGNPVRNPDMFFGRETEFELVKKRFSQSGRGSLMVFCGERRSGKTSILLQISQGRLGPEFIPVIIDMQAMAVDNETEFLSRIETLIIKQAGDNDVDLAPSDFGARSSAAGAFRESIEKFVENNPGKKLVLLFDEYELFEDKIEDGALGNDVLLILSSLMENYPIFLVFTGSQHLEERRAEYWRILEKAHEHRRVSYLHIDDTIRLIQDPVRGRATYPDEIVSRIIRLTAGQPFYTQAICLNLVDALNDAQKTTVDVDMLNAVVERIVENPFPQMTFLWDTLPRDEKLTLALLAETLEGGSGLATADELVETMKAKRYPLDLARPGISTAMESLFKQEILVKDKGREPGFAFRMDLWRLWIQRMHSVWQVMHEEGLEFRASGFRRYRRAIVVGATLAVGLIVLWLWLREPPSPDPGRVPPSPVPMGVVDIDPAPSGARLVRDGTTVAFGRSSQRIPSGRDHEFVVSATGYVDSTFTMSASEDETTFVALALRPEFGRVRLNTEPPGADLVLNGTPMGSAPVEQYLPVPDEHSVEVRLDGHHPLAQTFRVLPDTTIDVALQLDVITVALSVISIPDGAQIQVDGTPRGVTPFLVSDLPVGTHRFGARLKGYVSRETTMVVDESTDRLRLTLVTEPPGVLVVRGDRPALIYINEEQVGSGELPSSGETMLPAGEHMVEVVFRDGTSDEMNVNVITGKRVEVRWRERKLFLEQNGR